MSIKKIINCIEIAELIVIVLYLLSFFVIAPSWHKALPTFILVGGIILSIVYFIGAMISFTSFSANLFNRFDGNTQPRLFLFSVGLLFSNVALTGVTYLCKHYPGASLMITIGVIGLVIIVLYFGIKMLLNKQAAPPLAIKLTRSSSLISFPNKEVFLRFAAILLISIAIYYCEKKIPNVGQNSLFRNVFMEDSCSEKYSPEEMDIASAWYFIDRGNDREKVLKLYNLTESEYNQKVNRVVFGRDTQPFQKRQVTINDAVVEEALFSDAFLAPQFPIKSSLFVQPEDTAYINSLIPVFAKDYEPVFRDYYYLELIDRNTTDPKFKQFMSQLTKWKDFMDDGVVF